MPRQDAPHCRQRTADPMPGHEEFEVGAGMINAVETVKQSKSNSGGNGGKKE